MKNNPLDLAGRLQQLRKQQGLSQEELAGRLGVSRQAVSKWESAQAQPELEKLLALSDFFAVSCDYLLKGEEPTAALPLPPPAAPAAAPSAPPTAAPTQPKPARLASKPNRLGYVINASLWAWLGLLISWGLWDYYRYSWCALLGLGFVAISAALLAMGLSGCPAEQRPGLLRRFWRWSIWPISQMGLGLLYSGIASRGGLLAPILNPFPFFYPHTGIFLLCWGLWLVICLGVWRWSRRA